MAGLCVTGLLLQLAAGPLDWDVFLWPANAVALILMIAFLIVAYVLREKVYFFRFMATSQAAVPAIAAAALLTIVMGVTRQVAPTQPPADSLGLTRMLSFWPFVLTYLWMTVIVGMVAVKQLSKPSWRKWPVIVSHLGLFVALTCGTLGSADMQRLKMYCETGQPEWRALDAFGNVIELPVAIELKRFTIDEYPPKLMVIDSTGRPQPEGRPDMLTLDGGEKGSELCGARIRVIKILNKAVPAAMAKMHKSMPAEMNGHLRMDSLGQRLSADYVAWDKAGSAPAALISVTDANGKKFQGWVTCGNYYFPYLALDIANGRKVAMGSPEPQRYASVVRVFTQDGKDVEATVEVNRPLTVNGWKIYQLSYNEQMGKWSNVSVFELVKDPWLPAVYAGIFMLMAGAVGMFITAGRTGVKRKEEDKA